MYSRGDLTEDMGGQERKADHLPDAAGGDLFPFGDRTDSGTLCRRLAQGSRRQGAVTGVELNDRVVRAAGFAADRVLALGTAHDSKHHHDECSLEKSFHASGSLVDRKACYLRTDHPETGIWH